MSKSNATADEIISSALRDYRVEIVFSCGTWIRAFIKAPDLISARCAAKAIKEDLQKDRPKYRAKTLVKRWKTT